MKNFIRINREDNVVVALSDLKSGEEIECGGLNVKIVQDIARGHKAAICNIKSGENIVKYGFPIGHAVCDIKAGEWVHSHNMKTNLDGILKYTYEKENYNPVYKNEYLTFKGYIRQNGKAGIRNELWIVPTVGCVNSIADGIIKRFKEKYNPRGIDDIAVYKHNFGCSQLGEDHDNTRKILRDIVNHPNAGGILVLGLGCESNNIPSFKEYMGEYDESRVKFLVAQEVEDEIESGADILNELYEKMKCDKREDIPLSELKVGLKCGGSDGLSGITANPLVGAFSDYIIAQGGTTVLTEVPEMFGAETLLMKRARSKEIFDKTVNLINNFKEYFMKYDQPIYENPSPGNKKGGITTLEEKSLGCVQKGGKAEVADVLKYGEQVEAHGLNLLNAPGNDMVASTALAASGCQIILFTTGRGTPFGTFVPTIKISTNNELYNKKGRWIDFNAGELLNGTSMDELVKRLVEYVIETAGGEKTCNEKNNFKEISIFKSGVTL